MPVPLATNRANSDAADRIPLLEREIGALRRELESLRGRTTTDHAHGRSLSWVTTFLAALGVLLSIAALLRH